MGKLAVNVALLLPDYVNDICVELNQAEGAQPLVDLSKEDNYPHITLVMGVLDESAIDIAKDKLRELTGPFNPLRLELSSLFSQINPDGLGSAGFQVRASHELIKLHIEVMEALRNFLSDVSDDSMYYLDDGEYLAEVTKHWVRNYWRKHQDLEYYRPHVSLKCAHAEYTDLPINFTANRVAVCHMGSYASCRRILTEVEITA